MLQREAGGKDQVLRPEVVHARVTEARDHAVHAVAEHLASTDPDPEGAAHDIGVRWGRRMTDLLAAAPQAPGDLVDAHAGRIRLLMSSLGYQARADEPTRITLHQCPLRTEGAVPAPLVCQMHRGMLDEMLQTMSGGAVVGTLTPFAGADYCMIEVGAAS